MSPNYLPPFSGHEKGGQLFCRALWTVKVNFLVKTFGAMELSYIYAQEIDPRCINFIKKASYVHPMMAWIRCGELASTWIFGTSTSTKSHRH
jgi:hypothetical protein